MDRYSLGDRRAFDQLFERYERRAYAYFLNRTRSPDRAQDLYQELFLRVHRFRRAFDRKRKFSSWFFQIANRVAIDELRRVTRSGLAPLEDADTSVAPAAEVGALNRELVERALSRLTREHAEILVAAKVEGLPYGVIALRAGRSTVAVKQIVSRALRGLRAAHAAET